MTETLTPPPVDPLAIAEAYGRDAWTHGVACAPESYSETPHIQAAWVRGWRAADDEQRLRRGEAAIWGGMPLLPHPTHVRG